MIIVDSGLNTGNLAHSMGIDKVSKKQYNYIHFSPVLPNANTFPLPPLFGVERICFHFPPCFSNDASCLMVNIEWTPLAYWSTSGARRLAIAPLNFGLFGGPLKHYKNDYCFFIS